MEIFYASLTEAVLDSLKTVPILFLAYLLVSWFSHDHNHKFYKFLTRHSKTTVLCSSFLGCLPQCGFSSVMADLYSRNQVTLGTLIAVFVATSDEAIPFMLSYPEKIPSLIILIIIKIILAIFWGYLIDLTLNKFIKQKKSNQSTEHQEHHAEHAHIHECGHIHTDECKDDAHEHGECCADNIFLDAIMHTFEILLFIFIATFIINLIVEIAGTGVIESLFSSNIYLQILLASLVGLIPNCASSVLLVELYIAGGLAFPALLAGLTAGAGVGVLVLINKNRKNIKNTIFIIILQYLIGVISGVVISFIPYFMTI